ININTPTGFIFTGNLITINWNIYGQPPTQPASLTIQNRHIDNITVIDDNLNLQALNKTWNVSVPEGIYFLSINDGKNKTNSSDFTVFTVEVDPPLATDLKTSTLIVVIAIGSGVVLTLILVGIWYFRSRHKKAGSDIVPYTGNIYEEYVLSTDQKKF
ncbi:44403_t:CDS:2, partial [Gigaspora margarita]